ncbi:phage baseplate assembly protein [Roseomonas xinghualingensis]|uniref:phage baseplate assembly protein n=1 Tax=Roseomonas xinghualingensis TaxID=2986475 RepID=UPI0021F0E9AD|nr:hypothetical protein [Roseomonas sp. SXEYE001]MCV4206925.1 hypothetical protein [Roseomonas sp. SXEYE001]
MADRDGELKLLVDSRELFGWQEIRVTRGLERVPPDFSLLMAEGIANEPGFTVQPGQSCEVHIGEDLVLTGYVDRFGPSIDKKSGGRIGVAGRGKCQDLVDCSAYLKGLANQISNARTAEVIARLCGLFGIGVDARDGNGEVVPQFNVILTETCWDIIDRVARHSEFLAYEGTDGKLILSKLAQQRMASGFRQGVNVEHASAAYAYDQRYSRYEAVFMPVETLGDVARAASSGDFNLRAFANDDTIGAAGPGTGRRFRPLVLIAETTQNGVDIAQRRVNWEMARRIGRSQAISLTCDSWRDAAGQLWEPNRLVSVHVPYLGITDAEWVIAEVTYRRGKEGTLADLVLMPPAAFLPEPIVLQPFDFQTAEALRQADQAAGGGGPIP